MTRQTARTLSTCLLHHHFASVVTFGISYILDDLCSGSVIVSVYSIYSLIQIIRPLRIAGTQLKAPVKCLNSIISPMRCFQIEMFLCGSKNVCMKQGNEQDLKRRFLF